MRYFPLKKQVLALFSLACMTSITAMEPGKKFYYDYDGKSYYTQPLLKPVRPTQRAKQPCSLYEYFGLSSRFSEAAAINVKQLVVQHLLNARPSWCKETMVPHSQVQNSTYNADGTVLATASTHDLCLSDQRGRIVGTKKYPHRICSVVCHPTEPCFIVATENEKFDKIDSRGTTLKSINAKSTPLLCAVNAQSAELAALVSPQKLKIWPLRGGLQPYECAVDTENPKSLVYNTKGDTLAIADQTGIQVLDKKSGIITFLVMPDSAQGIAFNQRDELVAVTRSGDLMTWFSKGKGLAPNRDSKPSKVIALTRDFLIDRAVFSANGHMVAVGSNNYQNPIVLWNMRGEKVCEIKGYATPKFSFHPVANQLVLGHTDYLELWKEECFPTLEQLLIRTVLAQYLIKCICTYKKPGYSNSLLPEKFIDWMSDWFHLDKESLDVSWRTFSKVKQMALIKTYNARAKALADRAESRAERQRRVQITIP